MKVKNKIGLILCSLVTLICLGTFTQAASERLGTSDDAIIRAANPDSPSDDDPMISGINGAEIISFLRFSVSSGPSGYSKAQLGISFHNNTVLPEEIIVDVLNCSDNSWDEYNLTWNNAPSPLGVKIGEFILYASEFTALPPPKVLKYVDVTPYVTRNKHYSTFVLLTNAEVTLYCSSTFNTPYILYTVSDDAIPSYNVFIILGILGVLSILLYRKIQIKHK